MDYNNFCFDCFTDKGSHNSCPHCGYAPDNSKEAALYLAPGTLLSSKYLVGKVLGQGGFGITYLGWDTNLDIRIAIKEFFPQGLVSRVPGENSVVSYTGTIKDQFSFGVESFLREAKTLARFEHHPNIVTVRDFFKENNTAYMVMSFIEGLSLLEHLNRAGGSIPVEQAVRIIMPVLDALKEVHRLGIMHRDISPDNIFIDREGRVVIIDFGAARQEMREKSKSLSVILKAGYAPEEQYRSRGKQGPWTDIYAVGATFYRAITGQTPLEAIDRLAEDELIPPSQLGIVFEPALEKALLKALAVKAEERYQKVEEFQQVLIDALPDRSEKEIAEAVSNTKPEAKSRAKIIKDALDLQKKGASSKKKTLEEAPLEKKGKGKDSLSLQKRDGTVRVNSIANIRVGIFKYAVIIILFGLLLYNSTSLLLNRNTSKYDRDNALHAGIYDFSENNEAMVEILAIITELGDRLNAADGYYGDLHDVVVANGNRQGPEHDELYVLFNEWMYEVGATYLYSFIDGGGDYNLLIVDGAEPEDMDPYGIEYIKEPESAEAFATGKPTVQKITWMDNYGYGLQKTAYAPIFNSAGEISFLLCINYPVPSLEAFPHIMD